ncbi:uncharacterized protein [Nicotiana tomentosiformis]|uniref:uncharacterized protein n=1 Tax=Nicotiana tomentosiformis TaxID=4098 RepID=UPI00388C3EDD
MQGVSFDSDMLVLPIGGCNMVLGIQWLVPLGDILWNFRKVKMEFTIMGKKVSLRGIQPPAAKLIQSEESQRGAASLFSLEAQAQDHEKTAELHSVLLKYNDIYEEPKELPPSREHEHKIVLKEGTASINKRPYKYPAIQKDEIEKMIDEMLNSGVLRHSTSPYSSPIVLFQLVRSFDPFGRSFPDFKEFVVEIDALGEGIGAVLAQDNRLIAFFSKGLSDFIEGLLKASGKEVIFVVVDRLSKAAHIMALKHPYTALEVAQSFMDGVFRLHDMPKTIVSDMNKVSTSKFWQELFKLQKVSLLTYSAYHPQIDGQTEVANICLECYLRCMTFEKPKEWPLWLPLA